MPADDDQAAAAVAREVLAPYLALVEELGLCPWAEPARRGDEVRVAVRWWRGEIAELTTRLAAAARGWDDDPGMRVGLIVVPDLPLGTDAWRRVRDAVAAAAPRYAMADFHPEAPYAADTPARLVRLFRRSPDPLLQLVPHAILRGLARGPSVPSPALQAAILADPFGVPPPPRDVRERIAEDNFATAREVGVETIAARLAAMRARGQAAYAAASIAMPAGFGRAQDLACAR
ncbi:MAG: hypothetical protein R2939_14820 [Kofleriaceae bacterium]